MTDQKLVDELEKALRDEAYDGGFGYMGDEQFTAYVRTLAETAAEVVEKALTPTDDELEALATVIAVVWRDAYGTPADQDFANAVLAAGFRRTEEDRTQGEPSDALNLVIHAERVGTERDDPLILELAEALRAALRAAGGQHWRVEPGVVGQEGESRGRDR